MSGIGYDEKHELEKHMKEVASDMATLDSFFTINNDFEKLLIINKIKRNLDLLFLEFEKMLHPRDLKDF